MTQNNMLTDLKLAEMVIEFRQSTNRLLLLDYDGTLVKIQNNPHTVEPSQRILQILQGLASDKKNTIAIITGRNRNYISKWFSNMDVFIFAEHGAFIKEPGKEWRTLYNHDVSWKTSILPILYSFAEKNHGALVEEKTSSASWHYRNVDPDKVFDILKELYYTLYENITPDMNISVQEGKKVIEVKQKAFDKGSATKTMLHLKNFQSIIAIGDDITDEDMFKALPPYSYSFKVGYGPTWARMTLDNITEVFKILEHLN